MIRDAVKISTREMTDEGYLKGIATITCVGIQNYHGFELGQDFDQNKIYRVFRPPSTVFDKATIDSAKLKPVTYSHPAEDVTVETYDQVKVGHLGEQAKKIGDSLAMNFVVTNKDVIDAIKSGSTQVSCGYDSVVVEESGEYEGQPYDLRYDGPMIINHLAIVDKLDQGRCGNSAKILDSKTGASKMADEKLKVKDLDMSALMDKIVQEIQPKIEKMVETPDFLQKLASEVGQSIAMGFSTDADEDADIDFDDMDDMKDKKDMKDQDMDEEDFTGASVNSELDMMDECDMKDMKDKKDEYDENKLHMKDNISKIKNKKIRNFMKNNLKIIDMIKTINPNIEINLANPAASLRKALWPVIKEKAKTKSIAELMGVADYLASKRKKGQSFCDSITVDDNRINEDSFVPRNAIETRNFVKNMRGGQDVI